MYLYCCLVMGTKEKLVKNGLSLLEINLMLLICLSRHSWSSSLIFSYSFSTFFLIFQLHWSYEYWNAPRFSTLGPVMAPAAYFPWDTVFSSSFSASWSSLSFQFNMNILRKGLSERKIVLRLSFYTLKQLINFLYNIQKH